MKYSPLEVEPFPMGEKKMSDKELIKKGLSEKKPLREPWEGVPGEVNVTHKNWGEKW